jgi:hypothetical protein
MSNSPGGKFNVRVANILSIFRLFPAGPLTLSLRPEKPGQRMYPPAPENRNNSQLEILQLNFGGQTFLISLNNHARA